MAEPDTRCEITAPLKLKYAPAYAHSFNHAHHVLGDLDQARDHAKQALDRYTILGVPEADETRDFLSDLG